MRADDLVGFGVLGVKKIYVKVFVLEDGDKNKEVPVF
jgi:hypothetical protein